LRQYLRARENPPESAADRAARLNEGGVVLTWFTTHHLKGVELQEDNIRQRFFEREQFEAVRKSLPAYAWPVVSSMYLTGWRIRSEVLPLQWRQVDFQAGTVRLELGTTKNKDGRTFFLTPEMRTCLEAQRAATEALPAPDGVHHPVGVSPRWDSHEELQEGVEDRLQGRRGSWADPARLPSDGGQEPGARRGTALNEDGRPQDRGDLSPIRHRERLRTFRRQRRSSRRSAQVVTIWLQ
jgi:hypothetical protein